MFSRIGPELRGIRARARPVIARVGLAVADQAVIGIGGLLFSVLLARWVAADEFGAFMVAFAIHLLAQNVCDAAVIEPLAVYGAGKHAGRFHVYLGRLLVGFLMVSLVLAMLLAAGAGVVWSTDLTSTPVTWGLAGAAALQMVVYAATLAYDLGLRAMGSVKFAFLSRILPAAMTLTLGVALLFELGIVGIFVGNALAAATMLLVLRRAYRRELDRQPGADIGQRIAPPKLRAVGRPVAQARAVKMRSVA